MSANHDPGTDGAVLAVLNLWPALVLDERRPYNDSPPQGSEVAVAGEIIGWANSALTALFLPVSYPGFSEAAGSEPADEAGLKPT